MKTLLIVDLSNLYYCVKNHFGPGYKVDYRKLIQQAGDELVEAIAYGSETNDTEARAFKGFLRNLGFKLRYKQTKIFHIGNGKEFRKGDVDVLMAMDIASKLKDVDQVILCTADGDLSPCVQFVVDTGKVCKIYACRISGELKRVASSWEEISTDCLISEENTNAHSESSGRAE